MLLVINPITQAIVCPPLCPRFSPQFILIQLYLFTFLPFYPLTLYLFPTVVSVVPVVFVVLKTSSSKAHRAIRAIRIIRVPIKHTHPCSNQSLNTKHSCPLSKTCGIYIRKCNFQIIIKYCYFFALLVDLSNYF